MLVAAFFVAVEYAKVKNVTKSNKPKMQTRKDKFKTRFLEQKIIRAK